MLARRFDYPQPQNFDKVLKRLMDVEKAEVVVSLPGFV
jgi:hypothetical protein